MSVTVLSEVVEGLLWDALAVMNRRGARRYTLRRDRRRRLHWYLVRRNRRVSSSYHVTYEVHLECEKTTGELVLDHRRHRCAGVTLSLAAPDFSERLPVFLARCVAKRRRAFARNNA